jgi:hypothetical protein
VQRLAGCRIPEDCLVVRSGCSAQRFIGIYSLLLWRSRK